MRRICLRAWTAALAVAWAAALAGQPAPVTIESGRITGAGLDGVITWSGIPYAAPPVGDLRWRAPRPPRSWDGVRDAGRYGAACMQNRALGSALQVSSVSEDCLTLNVWAPKGASKAAVMVWIHGGAFVEGSGQLVVYNGQLLAPLGVVVVTINYRLGDFGLFAYPELSKESQDEPAANFGLMDQIAALRWVKRNIAAFGGDPDNVTIFGESAGGASVNFLMASPAARGLFQKAIAESGGAHTALSTISELEQSGVRKAAEWGAADLKVLRALPASAILAKQGRVTLGSYTPVIDGKYVTADPPSLFAAGKQAPVPFLLGANSFEASLMTTFGISPETILARVGGMSAQVRRLYGDNPERAAQDLFSDALFLEPARFLASQMEKVGKPAYLYFFSYVVSNRRNEARGASHGSEIPFVFDHLRPILGWFPADSDSRMAETMSAAWVRFAKTGNPNGAGLPEWPAYTSATDRLMEFGDTVEAREHFRAERLDLLAALRERQRAR